MPMQLLHILLALVHEVELRRDLAQILTPSFSALRLRVVLQGQVPQRQLVVSARDGDGRALVW
eukprot:CAMPEP_0181232596 /NCGR_PEP_ID=MMETSP1096-20121128/35828_1 /TAXON_ID=156174 ORGANISM="Chrysochromulina ericina, Strain CCMP281" /NCGR_SAMPLE_ID=MMETSP1096 /ASSEMBLY_ACC=CAM_ASM_000453 /LENGTH=62 /DNA_ID=CAMNT_0023326923 /DNA_START=220 /DNA_END=405 /DNA_ORIENTATION=-